MSRTWHRSRWLDRGIRFESNTSSGDPSAVADRDVKSHLGARAGRPPFLWTVFSNPGFRHELLRQARNDVGNAFIVTLVLDSIDQVIVHSRINAFELLLTATILALLP